MAEKDSFEKYFTNLVNSNCNIVTANGKKHSHFTMVCKFKDGKKFTYRGDFLLKNYKINPNFNIKNQLDALMYKYAIIKDSCTDCRIYNNKKPILLSLIFHQTESGFIAINTIMHELKELKELK